MGAILATHKVWTGVGVFMALGVIVYASNPHAAKGGAPPASAPAATATATARASIRANIHPAASVPAAAPSPSAHRKPAFPPQTVAAFRAFAATGDASTVRQIASSSEGLPSCPQPNIDVIVSPGLTVRELEADLSAFFVQSGLLGSQCQAFLFAYHSRSDYQANGGNGYTAGRVALTTNGGGGPPWNLEVDAGAADDFPAQFNFNF